MRKREVAPVSAMAWDELIIMPRAWWSTAGLREDEFDVTTVTSSSFESTAAEENKYWVGYGDLK